MENSDINPPGRILFLITTLGFGGAEAQLIRLASELKARNWRVSVVCMVTPKFNLTQLTQQDIEVHSLGMKSGVPDLRAVFRLRALIKSFQPHVVHCHMFHANILGRITRLVCSMPVLICTAHNIRETSRQGGPTWHKELLYRATDSLADRTTIISQAAFDRYVAVGAVPRKKLQLIENGIDTDVFSHSEELRRRTRKALGIDSKFVWLAVGRLVQQKDYPTLFNALERLGPKDFVVLIAGSGPLDERLREQCAEHGVSGHVRFCGSRENILDLYSAADAFVMSSEFEGLSVALLEAASMGLPAVVTNVGGNPEVITDQVTGYIVPPRAPAQLAAAMDRLMEASREERETMGKAARQHCLRHYKIATTMDKWLSLYAKCLPGSGLSRMARNTVTASK